MPNKKKKGFRRVSSGNQARIAMNNGANSSSQNRSSSRKQYTPLQMTSACKSVLEDGISANKAAAIHGVPPSTLKDRLSGRVKHGDMPGPKPYLSTEEEQGLATHLIEASSMGYGKTRRDVYSIVEQYVNQKEDVSLRSDKISNGWWQKFLKRNPNIRLRSGDYG